MGGLSHQWRLPIGWPVMGLCNRSCATPGLMVQSAKHHPVCVSSSDTFDVALYRFPLPLEGARGYPYFQHGGKVTCCCWSGQDHLLTASSRNDTVLQWRLTGEPVDPVAALRQRRLAAERQAASPSPIVKEQAAVTETLAGGPPSIGTPSAQSPSSPAEVAAGNVRHWGQVSSNFDYSDGSIPVLGDN